MTRRELEHTVAFGEGQHIEFKRKLPTWPKLVREVVAFANSDGGTVFVGVSDDGETVGVKDPREIEEAMELELGMYVTPKLDLEIEVVPLTRKRAVVCVHVEPGEKKPYMALESPDAHRGTALIRIADASVTASKEVYELLKYEGRERNMRVEYGDKEITLMRYLEQETCITLKKFTEIAQLTRQAASRTLVHLVKANVLRIEPGIEVDRYYQAL